MQLPWLQLPKVLEVQQEVLQIWLQLKASAAAAEDLVASRLPMASHFVKFVAFLKKPFSHWPPLLA